MRRKTFEIVVAQDWQHGWNVYLEKRNTALVYEGSFTEKHLALRAAKRLQAQLKKVSIKVV